MKIFYSNTEINIFPEGIGGNIFFTSILFSQSLSPEELKVVPKSLDIDAQYSGAEARFSFYPKGVSINYDSKKRIDLDISNLLKCLNSEKPILYLFQSLNQAINFREITLDNLVYRGLIASVVLSKNKLSQEQITPCEAKYLEFTCLDYTLKEQRLIKKYFLAPIFLRTQDQNFVLGDRDKLPKSLRYKRENV